MGWHVALYDGDIHPSWSLNNRSMKKIAELGKQLAVGLRGALPGQRPGQ